MGDESKRSTLSRLLALPFQRSSDNSDSSSSSSNHATPEREPPSSSNRRAAVSDEPSSTDSSEAAHSSGVRLTLALERSSNRRRAVLWDSEAEPSEDRELPHFPRCLICQETFIDEVTHCPRCGEAIAGGPSYQESRPGELLRTLAFDDRVMFGGLSHVYPTRHPETGDQLAVKVSKKGSTLNGEFLIQEGVAMRVVAHPNIPKVHEQGRLADGTPYLIIDFIEGHSLQAMIDDHGPISAGATTVIGIGLANILAHVHSRGILHRDIKPDNVIVAPGPQPYLIDFGTALFLEDGEEPSEKTTGTTWYMPPEQLTSDVLDYSADVYALGVSLYQMLSGGILPFHDDDPTRVAILKVTEDPLPIREYFPDVPDLLNDIIMKAIARERADRYDSAQILKEALEGFLLGMR